MKRKLYSVTALLYFVSGLFLWLCSCANIGANGPRDTEAATKDNLKAATAIVWTYYGRTDPPPHVFIVDKDDMTCVDPISNRKGFPVLLTSGMSCREGYTISPLWTQIVIHDEDSWHTTALAHELQHVAQARKFIIDPGHIRIEWSTEVPAANALLQSRGY